VAECGVIAVSQGTGTVHRQLMLRDSSCSETAHAPPNTILHCSQKFVSTPVLVTIQGYLPRRRSTSPIAGLLDRNSGRLVLQ
jgi:hypothetical protein